MVNNIQRDRTAYWQPLEPASVVLLLSASRYLIWTILL